MEFRIADTFTASLARLTGDEQKAVKTTAFDLQLNPANPGMSFHKLDKARDKNFWSVRVSGDLRLIVHRTPGSLLLCYVDHHNRAYGWAERRKLETHPKTGAAQLVEIRETIQEVLIPTYVTAPKPVAASSLLFATLALAAHLPGEAAEALLELATGGQPRSVQPAPAITDPFAHPDALRRFRVMSDTLELERALEFPWEKWTIFLHPEQRQWVEREQNGPARVSGSAGTGKTIVALHRAVFLARSHPDARVLLTTFSAILANALRNRLIQLVKHEPRLAERIDIYSVAAIGSRLYQQRGGITNFASEEIIRTLLQEAGSAIGSHKFTLQFLQAEWAEVVDARQLGNWEEYRAVVRLGRKTRLPEAQRSILWSIFTRVCAALTDRNLITPAGMFTRLAGLMSQSQQPPFDFVIVDEAQDMSIAHLRFFAALGAKRPDALFFAGDLGQRIFQQTFSWKALGVDVRGRSRTLRINYRTSHQIRTQADRLLGAEVTDIDGNREQRDDTVSVFNGPPPQIQILNSQAEENKAVSLWLANLTKQGVEPHEFGIFVRSTAEISRAYTAATEAGLPFRLLTEQVETTAGHISISTMHLAKGLEFRAVAVMACDDEVIPLQERIEAIGDDADLQEVYATERHLLYVACTRARDHLLVTSVAPASEFLDDLRG